MAIAAFCNQDKHFLQKAATEAISQARNEITRKKQHGLLGET
jgi:hypothetical protein